MEEESYELDLEALYGSHGKYSNMLMNKMVEYLRVHEPEVTDIANKGKNWYLLQFMDNLRVGINRAPVDIGGPSEVRINYKAYVIDIFDFELKKPYLFQDLKLIQMEDKVMMQTDKAIYKIDDNLTGFFKIYFNMLKEDLAKIV